MYSASQLRSYKKIEVETASKEKLLVMVYNGAIQFCESAKISYSEENALDAQYYISRAQTIIMELINSLNMEKGEGIANNLFSLYEYILGEFVEVRKGKVELLDNVISILTGLKDAWQDIANDVLKPDVDESFEESESFESPKVLAKTISFSG